MRDGQLNYFLTQTLGLERIQDNRAIGSHKLCNQFKLVSNWRYRSNVVRN
jgi:hypothetical protein